MTKAFIAALCLAAGVLAACSGGGPATQSNTHAALRNPLDFPLYPGASLISTKAFTQVIHSDASSGYSAYAQGNGTYTGHEVIASSSAAFSALSAWLDRLNSAPPSGYTAEEPQNNPYEQNQSQRYGLAYAAFTKKAGAHTRGVLVMVMDPRLVNQRFGAILGMIDKYKAMPALLRGPLDNAAKERFGMTITQATQPESPIGAALAALGDLEHKNARGIVVVDAQKQ